MKHTWGRSKRTPLAAGLASKTPAITHVDSAHEARQHRPYFVMNRLSQLASPCLATTSKWRLPLARSAEKHGMPLQVYCHTCQHRAVCTADVKDLVEPAPRKVSKKRRFALRGAQFWAGLELLCSSGRASQYEPQ